MKAWLLCASCGYGARKGNPWILLSYAYGAHKKHSGDWPPAPANDKSAPCYAWRYDLGLKFARSFVPVEYQEEVKNFLRGLEDRDFPHLVHLETSTNEQDQVVVIGISTCQDPDFNKP